MSIQIPDYNSDWYTIASYALTFNGYRFVNGGPLELSYLYDKVATDPENASLDELRACLFYLQRAVRFTGNEPTTFDVEEARTLITMIKSKVI